MKRWEFPGLAAGLDAWPHGVMLRLPRSGPLSYLRDRGGGHLHRGIDLPALAGTPVYAPLGGIVTHASSVLARGFSGYGAHVVIDTMAGQWHLAAHLQDVYVRPGELITAGQQIGTVGDTCFTRSEPNKRCRDPHLHWETSPRPYPQPSEAQRVDPVAVLDALQRHPLEPHPAGQWTPARPQPPLGPVLVVLGFLAALAAALVRSR